MANISLSKNMCLPIKYKMLKVKVFVHLFQKVVGSGKARGFELRLAVSEAEPRGFKT